MSSSYTLTITAQDKNPNSVPGRAKLFVEVLDLNDNSPNIKLNMGPQLDGHLKVSEYAPNGTFLAHITVSDSDSGQAGKIQCFLSDPRFVLTKMYETDYKIVTNAVFDREAGESYIVGITCADQGEPPQTSVRRLTIDVLDENDHPPVFQPSRYKASLPENNEVGIVIISLTALDRDHGDNAKLSYFIYDDPAMEENFAVDAASGDISAKRSFDREETPDFNFTVIATDHGEPKRQAIASVYITVDDLNDQQPTFTQDVYEFVVTENVDTNYHIGKVTAIDNDSNKFNGFTYSLEGPQEEVRKFRIDDLTGDIVCKGDLDSEHVAVYYFTAVATSFDGERQFASVIIHDLNYNGPEFQFPSIGSRPSVSIVNTVIIASTIIMVLL
ncbi:hypothetical protein CAPTEDRAFT_218787 [Capitella teleta]|uniref:Cadherin domain-containing protein n=1 Tax=Capitella teleta TaxID=283909 RepID=R7ULT4_CAPTE|nr:hypothetical protein CAPTEDRAFT_218787 [Capitella teleta]|eukprot:ELU04897.1 hypothetical protein CAPTEDRAFT_218787 [Capitella teleta]